MIQLDLNITCLQDIGTSKYSQIYIANKKIVLTNSVLKQSQYNMSTMSDVGVKTYNFYSLSADNTQKIFNIVDLTEQEEQ